MVDTVYDIAPNTVQGRTANGELISTAVTQFGDLQVSIQGPSSPYGSVHSENFTPAWVTGSLNTREDQ